MPGGIRDQHRYDDHQRRVAVADARARCRYPRPAVDRRRLQPRVRGARARGRQPRRPLRPPAGSAGRAARLRRRQRAGRAVHQPRRADRRPRPDGDVRGADLPDHAVGDHQHLHRARGARQGGRRLGRGDRARRRGRARDRRAAADRLQLAQRVRRPDPGRAAGRVRGLAGRTRVQGPEHPADRPAGPAQRERRGRRARLHDHRSPGLGLGIGYRPWSASRSP